MAPEAWASRVFSRGSQLSSVSFVSLQNDIPCIFVQGFFGEAEDGEAHWVKRPGWGWQQRAGLFPRGRCALHLKEQSPGSPCRSRLPLPVSNALKRLVQLNNSPPSGSSDPQTEFHLAFLGKENLKISGVGAIMWTPHQFLLLFLLSSAQKETALSCLAQVKGVSLMPQSSSSLFPFFLVLQWSTPVAFFLTSLESRYKHPSTDQCVWSSQVMQNFSKLSELTDPESKI